MNLSFKENVGPVDRIVRIILGMVFIYLAAFEPFALHTVWSTVLWILGSVFVIEGAVGY